MTTIQLPSKNQLRLALLGHGHHLCTLMRRLMERGFSTPVIVTHPRPEHERDRLLLTDPNVYQHVFDLAEAMGVEVIESTTINSSDLIRHLKARDCTAAFSCSCRSIIGEKFIRAFDGLVFNLHPSLLPRERGGGTFSWRIMNGSREVSATLHMVDEGIDTGLVLHQKTGTLAPHHPVPNDFMAATNRVYAELIEYFLDAAESGRPIKVTPQIEDEASYLPRLHTETNGAIDWSWPVEDLERFIRSFGPPYPGAFTLIGQRRAVILQAEAETSATPWHPYAVGRVLARLSDGSIRVVVNGGYLRIRRIAIDNWEAPPAELVGIADMLSTPPDLLFRAHNSVVSIRNMKAPESAKNR